ncbi:hypothetical protein [Acidiphilium acidophilum]|uniref:sulfotransferase family protein n=1 Tax=Acidiphilium acidophilum TaxID=76588 RepID=UPI002E8E696A|nr:hypothetical protein [Acidiphilium acidophilum]
MNPHAQRRQAILVLGMHRSGTSALTRVIALCGAGLPQHLMPASENVNATGFWESQALVDFHDEVLAAIGATWSDVRHLPPAWFAGEAALRFRHRLGALLDIEYGDMPLIVVKDPRLCRLLPLWLPVLRERHITARVVIPVRHPHEVAASLERREGFDQARAIALWQTHMLDAERDSRGLVRRFVAYDALLADWETEIARLGATIGIDLIANVDRDAVSRFLSAGLRHHVVGPGDAALPEWVAGVYRWMMAAVSGQEPPCGDLDGIAAAMAQANAYYGPVVAALETELAARMTERQHWIDTAVDRYAIIEDLRREIERLSAFRPDAAGGGSNS